MGNENCCASRKKNKEKHCNNEIAEKLKMFFRMITN